MEHGPIEWGALAWFSGWLVAVAVLFFAGLQLPLQTRLARGRSLLYNGIVVAAALAIAALACTASILHDLHLDLTREKIYTPSSQAMAVVDRLERPVQLTYFYPDGMLQYVAVEGRRELYLLSRFVGQEWDAAAKGALGG